MKVILHSGKLVDASAPVNRRESNMLHKFKLPMPLAGLQSFGGPQVLISEGSWLGNNNHSLIHQLGVKSGVSGHIEQKIDAIVRCQVQKNDGKRHPLEKK